MWFDTILWLVAIVAFGPPWEQQLPPRWCRCGSPSVRRRRCLPVSLHLRWASRRRCSRWYRRLRWPLWCLTLTRHRKEHKPPVTNGSPLTIGKQGIVLVAIEPGMPGRVRVDGLDWQARAEVAIPQGARICVADVDGAVLLVTPVTEAMSVE